MKAVFLVSDPLFHLEARPMPRSSIRRDGSKVTVEAKDAVAFRAACNAVLKELILIEKSRRLVRKI